MRWIFYLLPLLAGVAMAIQSGINSQLRVAVQQPILAAFISFLGGTIFLGIILLFMRHSLPGWQTIADAEWYKFTGGLLGSLVVTSVILSVQRIGAASMFVIILAAQLVMALLMDHFALLGMRQNPISMQKIAGIALVVAGVWLVNRK
jgi:transporter family-2 protein